nr:phage antirepressor N-terminal domain-containing protein [uncultured Draconibacterium sp.]
MYDLQKILKETIHPTDDGNIFVEPVCDFFGINYRNQLDRINRDKVCQKDMRKNSNFLLFGNNYQRVCLGRKGFIRWIQIINTEIVRTELRNLFEDYQVAVFDFLYHASEIKNNQLEDVRDYTVNINAALDVIGHIKEYISEQRKHRDLCLELPPAEWAKIKDELIQKKALPNSPVIAKALEDNLPNDIEALRKKRNMLSGYILKNNNLIKYSSRKKKPVENPMKDVYRRAKLEVSITKWEKQIEIINEKIIQIEKEGLSHGTN